MKILIAEDDLYTRQALEAIFEGEGWEVKTAADGRSALQVFENFCPDLVCLDIMMPGQSGYEVCKQIRKTGSMVPVLFISAKSEEIDKVLGLELGADDFIVKPFGVREVVARVRAVMRRSGPQTPGTPALPQEFPFGPWLIKSEQLRAFNGNTVQELTLREVKILALLAGSPGTVITREAFFRFCWDLESAPASRTLDQHVAQLRKKIEPDPAAPMLIKTVQGAGYRYEGPEPTLI